MDLAWFPNLSGARPISYCAVVVIVFCFDVVVVVVVVVVVAVVVGVVVVVIFVVFVVVVPLVPPAGKWNVASCICFVSGSLVTLRVPPLARLQKWNRLTGAALLCLDQCKPKKHPPAPFGRGV
jgi:hypothetical protein